MKCRNCGYRLDSGQLTCPICGKHNIGAEHCAVCETLIMPGQQHCTRCGNPTSYCKHSDEEKYHVQGISYQQHSKESHVYSQQPSYDFKANEYVYQSAKKIKSKYETFNKQQLESNKGRILGFLLALTIIATIAIGIFSDTESVDFNLDSKINLSSMMYNDGKVYQTEGQVALGGNQILIINHEFKHLQTLDTPAVFVTISDEYVYYLSSYSYYRQKLNDDEPELLIDDVLMAQKVGSKIYYLDMDNNLYRFDLFTRRSNPLKIETKYFFVEDNKIYYSDTKRQIMVKDLSNKQTKTLIKFGAEKFVVNNEDIYYVDYQGIHQFDHNSNEKLLVEDYQINKISVSDNGLVYTTLDDKLSYYDFEDEESIFLFEDVHDGMIVGELVLYSKACDDHGYDWLVSEVYSDNSMSITEN